MASEPLSESIFEILLARGSSTALEIRHALAERDRRTSHQAIYYSLDRLGAHGKVIKLGKRFAPDVLWLRVAERRLRSARSRVVKTLHGREVLNDLTLAAGSLAELHRVWAGVVSSLLLTEETDRYVEWAPHAWFHLSRADLEDEIVANHEEQRLPYDLIVGHRSEISKGFMKFRAHVPGKVEFAPECPARLENQYLSVVGDYVITITLDPSFSEHFTEAVSKSSTPHATPGIRSLFQARTKIKLQVTRNAIKAGRVRSILLG